MKTVSQLRGDYMWIAMFKSGHFNLEDLENTCRASVVDDVHDEKTD